MRHITLTGASESAGRALGNTYKDELERIIWADSLRGLSGYGGRTPSRNTERIFRSDFPEEYAYIKALADGAILDTTRLFEMYSLELGRAFGLTPPVKSILVALPRFNGDSTDNSTPALGVVMDTPASLSPMASLITRRPDRGPAWMELGFAPFCGAFFGINEKGLALALGLKPCAEDTTTIIPASLAIRRALNRTTNLHDAVSSIEETPRGASGFVAVADKESALIVEFTPDAVDARSADDSRPTIAAQHFLAPRMMGRDIPHDDTYPGDAPEGLRWTRIYESSERRFTAARDILHAKSPVTGRDLTDMLTDESAGLTLDGPYYHTLLCAVLLPRRGSIFLSTREDAGAYTRYALND